MYVRNNMQTLILVGQTFHERLFGRIFVLLYCECLPGYVRIQCKLQSISYMTYTGMQTEEESLPNAIVTRLLSVQQVSAFTPATNKIPCCSTFAFCFDSFLFAQSSLLVNHSLIINVHWANRRNGQQWIKGIGGRTGASEDQGN